MYVLLALAVQTVLAPLDTKTLTSPIEAVVTRTVSSAAGVGVSVLGVVIIVANLIGAIWGASRLVMSSAREGLLPRRLARIDDGNPRIATGVVAAALLAVIGATALHWASISDLLAVAARTSSSSTCCAHSRIRDCSPAGTVSSECSSAHRCSPSPQQPSVRHNSSTLSSYSARELH